MAAATLAEEEGKARRITPSCYRKKKNNEKERDSDRRKREKKGPGTPGCGRLKGRSGDRREEKKKGVATRRRLMQKKDPRPKRKRAWGSKNKRRKSNIVRQGGGGMASKENLNVKKNVHAIHREFETEIANRRCGKKGENSQQTHLRRVRKKGLAGVSSRVAEQGRKDDFDW